MPKFRDLKDYCERTGWELYNKKESHYYYRKVMDDGTVLKTMVSHSLSSEIGPELFAQILKKQLHTTKEEFNQNC